MPNGPPSSSPDAVAADPSSRPLVPFSLLPAIALTIPFWVLGTVTTLVRPSQDDFQETS